MKKCPVLAAAHIIARSFEPAKKCECGKEKCAWWDEVEEGRCAIISLVGSLDDIATKLMHIDEGITKLVNDELRRYSRG